LTCQIYCNKKEIAWVADFKYRNVRLKQAMNTAQYPDA